MILEKEIIIPAEHPSLTGHFPGHPVVPGVVIIDEVMALINEYNENLELVSISHMKFSLPLLAGQVCRMVVNISDHARVTIECQVNGRTITKGKLVLLMPGSEK